MEESARSAKNDKNDKNDKNAWIEAQKKKCALIANLKCNSNRSANKCLASDANHKRRDAISELEQMYHNLNLDDDQLLDRAERRDLPLKFQISWHKSDHNHNDRQAYDDNYGVCSPQSTDGHNAINDGMTGRKLLNRLEISKRRSIGTLEALHALRDNNYNAMDSMVRSRTPPYRRSALPDIIRDDLAFRKYKSNSYNQLCTKQVNHNDNSLLTNIYTNNNYSLHSLYLPAFDYLSDEIYKDLNHLSKANIVYDDLSYRKLKQSKAANVSPPHPPFGIPNTVISHSSTSDYLHNELDQNEKNKKRYRCKSSVPHLIHDDMAFRNLRKDAIRNNTVKASKLNASLALPFHPNPPYFP